jgi:hypothetical protein
VRLLQANGSLNFSLDKEGIVRVPQLAITKSCCSVRRMAHADLAESGRKSVTGGDAGATIAV